MPSQTLHLPEIFCGHCVDRIQSEMSEMPGIISVKGDAAAKTITITWEQPAGLNDIITVLADMGYPADNI